MKKLLLTLITIISLSFAFSIYGHTTIIGDKAPISFFIYEDNELTGLEIEDLLNPGNMPKGPGMGPVDVFQGDGIVLLVFNKLDHYKVAIKNANGGVVYSTVVSPAVEEIPVNITGYASGKYSVTFSDAQGKPMYGASFMVVK